ncbi:MAG: hypothetical protein ACI9FU_000244 [Granulosicoccus sp.]|jgi:hypothetical protein
MLKAFEKKKRSDQQKEKKRQKNKAAKGGQKEPKVLQIKKPNTAKLLWGLKLPLEPFFQNPSLVLPIMKII